MDFENGNITENWQRWAQNMQLLLSGPLADSDEAPQCSYVLLNVGQTGRDIFNTLELQKDQRNKINIFFDKFKNTVSQRKAQL